LSEILHIYIYIYNKATTYQFFIPFYIMLRMTV